MNGGDKRGPKTTRSVFDYMDSGVIDRMGPDCQLETALRAPPDISPDQMSAVTHFH